MVIPGIAPGSCRPAGLPGSIVKRIPGDIGVSTPFTITNAVPSMLPTVVVPLAETATYIVVPRTAATAA